MNNITAKNIKNNVVPNTTMPYTSQQNVNLKAGQIINATLNYAWQKMLDNDLFIERSLEKQSAYDIGPLAISEVNSSKIDGLKYYEEFGKDQPEFQIYAKHNIPLSNTIENLSVESGQNITTPIKHLHKSNFYWTVQDSGILSSNNLQTFDDKNISSLNSVKLDSIWSNESNVILAKSPKYNNRNKVENPGERGNTARSAAPDFCGQAA